MKKQYFLWKITSLFLFSLISLPAVAQNWELKQDLNYAASRPMNFTVTDDYLFVTDGQFHSKIKVYKKTVNGWAWQQDLVQSDSQIYLVGTTMYADGNTFVMNSYSNITQQPNLPRKLHIYHNTPSGWVQTQQISEAEAGATAGGCTLKDFAFNVVLKDSLIYVATSEDCGGTKQQVVYLYQKNNSEWFFVKKIAGSGPELYGTYQPLYNVVEDWVINCKREFYKVSDCLASSGVSCGIFQTPLPIIYNSIPLGGFNRISMQRTSTKMFTTLTNVSMGKSELYTHTLMNGSWSNMIPLELPRSGMWYDIAHSDTQLIVCPNTGNSQNGDGTCTPIQSKIYIYEKQAQKWILKNTISLPLISLPTGCNGGSYPHRIEILDADNFLICTPVEVPNFTHNQVIRHYSRGNNNLIRGNIYADMNINCQKENNEHGIGGFLIKDETSGKVAYSEPNGDYELVVGTGTHTITQIIPQNRKVLITQSCPANVGSRTVTFNTTGNQANNIDFANQVPECTYLTVDVTSRRRRCFRNQTIVKYENEGFFSADNAYITVTFPEYVIPLSSTNPWVSKVGNTYKFNVGTLQVGQSGQFVVTDSVACVAGIQGLIQCTEAKIYPKNTCASPTWSGASLEIVGKCLDVAPHKGRFVLRNTGTASMQSAYKVWRGNTLILNNILTLAQGDSLALEIPTNGENLFIQAAQSTGHPDGEMVSAMVMNCGNNLPTSAGSPNLQMMILPNDEYANSELDCMPIVDSYDPNDKAVTPAGITENNYVKPNTELEYKIRFQNMGTAEAVNIVVIDTLSQHLDLTTFQMMSVSHTYKLKFERVNGKQVAFWTFTDINLPAKSINEPASHGYIKFKIKHLPTLVEGTIIKNFADIYFDFNEPVRTNETAINMTDYQFPVNPVDYCSLFTQAQAGQARTVCGDAYTLEGNLPTMGQGTWTRISGAGEIAEPHKPNAIVTNLGVGENIFRWTLAGVPDCANTESQVTIKRMPIVATVSVSNNASNNIACAEETITFSAQTNNVGNAPIYQWKVNGTNVGTNSPTFSTNTLQNQDKVSVEVQTNLACNNSPKIISQAIDITIKAKPAKPIVSHTALYELKASVEGDSYAWYKDNVLITNNLPTLKVQKLGKYKVVVTQNGCYSPTSDEFVLNSEALKRFADLVKVETYPNPTTGKFTLNIINNQGSAIDIQIYDSVGKLITEQKVEASEDIDCKVAIDLTRYKQGVYYVQISNQQGLKTTHKIVVQKQ